MEFGDYTGWCPENEKKNRRPEQRNVLALVGNGFDIQVLQDLGVQGDTSYTSFYHFLKMRKFNEENCIFRLIEDGKWEKDYKEYKECFEECKDCQRQEEKCKECLEEVQKENRGNWSDIEEAIQELVNGVRSCCRHKERKGDLDELLAQDLSEIQSEFSEFLNQLVTPKVLDDLSKLVQGNDQGKRDKLVDDVKELLASDYKRKRFLVLDGVRRILLDKEKEEQLDKVKNNLKTKHLKSANESARKRLVEDLYDYGLSKKGDKRLFNDSDELFDDLDELFNDLDELFDGIGKNFQKQLLRDLEENVGRKLLRRKVEKVLLGKKWPEDDEFFEDLKFLLDDDERGGKWLRDVLKEYLQYEDNRKPLTLISFQNFLGDLDEDELKETRMKDDVGNHSIFNFHFINFNYTFLFDNYIYLDQEQFAPKPYKGPNCNISFRPNPHGFGAGKPDRDTSYSSLLVTHAPIHPHGIQTVPRSILFGIDVDDGGITPETYGTIDDHPEWKFAKPYWAQTVLKYGPLIEDADYFIIFGTSLGKTDRWWWDRIGERIYKNEDVEVILYWWVKNLKDVDYEGKKEEARKKFAEMSRCSYETIVKKQVRVVLYDSETERAWLNTNPRKVPAWADRAQDWRDK